MFPSFVLGYFFNEMIFFIEIKEARGSFFGRVVEVLKLVKFQSLFAFFEREFYFLCPGQFHCYSRALNIYDYVK